MRRIVIFVGALSTALLSAAPHHEFNTTKESDLQGVETTHLISSQFAPVKCSLYRDDIPRGLFRSSDSYSVLDKNKVFTYVNVGSEIVFGACIEKNGKVRVWVNKSRLFDKKRGV